MTSDGSTSPPSKLPRNYDPFSERENHRLSAVYPLESPASVVDEFSNSGSRTSNV